MNRIKFKIEIPKDIFDIYQIFKNNGYELMLVGGCVRDSLLNQSIKDYDLVTNATPDRIIELLKNKPIITNIIETGKSYTHPKHECNDIRNIVYTNTEYYTTERCMICDTIIKFKWKSWWKRLISIF